MTRFHVKREGLTKVERAVVQCVVGIYYAHLALWLVTIAALLVELLRMVTP